MNQRCMQISIDRMDKLAMMTLYYILDGNEIFLRHSKCRLKTMLYKRFLQYDISKRSIANFYSRMECRSLSDREKRDIRLCGPVYPYSRTLKTCSKLKRSQKLLAFSCKSLYGSSSFKMNMQPLTLTKRRCTQQIVSSSAYHANPKQTLQSIFRNNQKCV